MDKSIAIYCYVNRCNGCNPAKVTAEDRRTVKKATATMAEAAIQSMIINSRLSRRGRMSWCSRCRPPLTLVLARYRLGSISHLQTTWDLCVPSRNTDRTLTTAVRAAAASAAAKRRQQSSLKEHKPPPFVPLYDSRENIFDEHHKHSRMMVCLFPADRGPCCRRAGRRQTLSTEVGAISFTAQVLGITISKIKV